MTVRLTVAFDTSFTPVLGLLATALGDDFGDEIASDVRKGSVLTDSFSKPNEIAPSVVGRGVVLPYLVPEACSSFAIGMR